MMRWRKDLQEIVLALLGTALIAAWVGGLGILYLWVKTP